MIHHVKKEINPASLSARRAWIEMPWLLSSVSDSLVALRKESVDRNHCLRSNIHIQAVALRKESVDRNKYVVQCRKVMGVSLSARRAWIEIPITGEAGLPLMSLSARRAWIEIFT